MTFNELNKLASQNAEMPNVDYLDAYVFQALRYLYCSYRDGFINKENAQKQRNQIKVAMDNQLKTDSLYNEYLERLMNNSELSQNKRIEITKAKTQKEKLSLCYELIEMLTGDSMVGIEKEEK